MKVPRQPHRHHRFVKHPDHAPGAWTISVEGDHIVNNLSVVVATASLASQALGGISAQLGVIDATHDFGALPASDRGMPPALESSPTSPPRPAAQ